MAGHILDLDREPLELVEDAYAMSRSNQQVRNDQYTRDYKLYHGFIDVADRDPDRSNIHIPKIFSIIETKCPRDVKALIGTRPYIPFDAKRKEYRDSVRVNNDIIDYYLDKGSFYDHFVSATKIKTLYGTSFLEAIPFYETIMEKSMQPVFIPGIPQPIDMELVEKPVRRLRFRIKEYAPWEIYIDPFATSLEEKGGCLYVVKQMLVRRDQIIEMAEKGAYPGLDIEALLYDDNKSSDHGDHWGVQMLSEMGLTDANSDDGVGIVTRFESEGRYIDVWNGRTVLRDIPNPFKHGMINLTRYIHVPDAHSQNRFWGIGEAKPNEILQHMLNDTWNMTFDNHNMMNQGMTYYRKDSVNPDALVRTVGNKVAIDSDSDRPITHDILETFGQPLPLDHYQIPSAVERFMDLGSGIFELQRGEQSQSDRTATESAMRKEYGDSRQELNVRMGEMITLKSFGEKMISMVDQFANEGDVVEVVGVEGAQQLMGLNPADLPGGYNFTFKGADKFANQLVKQRNWKELLPLMLQIPNVLPGKLGMKMLEVFDEDEPSAREMVIPDEVMQQMQQQAAEQEKIDIEMQERRDHERDMELAELKASKKEHTSKLKDNNRKSKGKGAVHSKNQPKHDSVSEAQSQGKNTRDSVQ